MRIDFAVPIKKTVVRAVLWANSKGRPQGRPLQTPACLNSAGIIHVELNWMRRHVVAHHFRHFQLDVAFDEVLVEHAACGEVGVVLLQARQRFAQRTADCGDFLQFLLVAASQSI